MPRMQHILGIYLDAHRSYTINFHLFHISLNEPSEYVSTITFLLKWIYDRLDS